MHIQLHRLGAQPNPIDIRHFIVQFRRLKGKLLQTLLVTHKDICVTTYLRNNTINMHLLYNSNKNGEHHTVEFTINIGTLHNITLQIIRAILATIIEDTCFDYSTPYAAIMDIL